VLNRTLRRNDPFKRGVELGELIYTNIAGGRNIVPTYTSKKLVLIFLDDVSDYFKVFLLLKKSELSDYTLLYFKYIKNNRIPVQRLRGDNIGENQNTII